MSKLKGFSLIELMVVIAIVAIMSAIAIPAYKNYIVKTKISQVTNVMNTLANKSVLYSQSHAGFGNAYDLGLSSTPGSGAVDNPSALLPDPTVRLNNTQFIVSDNNDPPCGKQSVVFMTLDPYALGIPGAVQGVSNLFVFIYNFNVNGTIYTFRFYNGTLDGLVPAPGDYISGWENAYLPDGSANPNVTDAINNIIANSSCQ